MYIALARSRATIFQQAATVLLLFTFTNYSAVALAQIVAALGTERTAQQVNTTSDNRLLSQIVQPNSVGLLHNKYRQFDVHEQGMIFNNSD